MAVMPATVDQLIADVAARLSNCPPGPGREAFVAHYVRHVDVDELLAESAQDLAGLIDRHLVLGSNRVEADPRIDVYTPGEPEDAWDADGATIVQVVTDDGPFIVDTISMTVTTAGWNIREVYHPQFRVERALTGEMRAVPTSDGPGRPESWVTLEITAPLGTSAESLKVDLRAALETGLDEVEEAVEDLDHMRTRLDETIDLCRRAPRSAAEVADAVDLLTWLADDHFTLLGYREHTYAEGRFVPVVGTGLGVLRPDGNPAGTFDALPLSDPPDLVIMTKNSAKSTVHRPAYTDYVGVRILDADGQVMGEHRFLGLLTSEAYQESITHIPVLRARAEQILARSGYSRDSHGGRAILATLNSFPRDELFQASVDELSAMIEPISRLKERRRVRVFVRRGTWGRFVSCLVYLPRDRYNTDVRLAMMGVIRDTLGAESLEYQAQVTESVLARLYFVAKMPDDAPSGGEIDVPALEQRLADVARGWDDQFSDLASHLASEQRGVDFPTGYKSDFTPAQALADLAALNALPDEESMGQALYASDDRNDRADLRLKVFRRKQMMLLSDVMPVLTSLGLTVVDEWPYELTLRGEPAMVYEFGLALPPGQHAQDWDAVARRRLMDAFEAAWRGWSEADALNALVATAALDWREVALLRAIARFLRQAGSPFSLAYLAEALTSNTDLAIAVVRHFQAKFDPDLADAERPSAMVSTREELLAGLETVASLDHDRILRQLLAVVDACVRSNWYVVGAPALTFKILSHDLDLLPQPRPAFEIYVYSPRVEGVHLRFGKVARGGLRWSDRPEDFRTEVLGLVKAQMVKNTVIVPVGAKGGFHPRHLPNPAVDRAAWMAEGVACYQVFVGALLDLTDNIVDGVVVPPSRVVRHDDDDPYLVVAADKGTATFSDIANALSIGRGFWLGDAFASGGSVGYDHKAMGITARGAWESVKRHFAELGRDCQTEDFTCVGIGDMAGDVFGNGMLLSRHTRLVAAFNHQHIFIDPNPDAERSFVERERMFALPRSTWADYDRSTLSAGGAIHARSAKSITLSAQARQALGIDAVGPLTPNDVIHAILVAPVDLFWNGGIGTYVKAASETHAQVADKANDAVRVNGGDVRALVAGEGGNLGWTQLGRIEFAARGGHINTDFIDNSAGVDTSDHEVNIKILLAGELAAGRLTLAERDELLPRMTDDVASLVLHHNVDQNLALSDAMQGAASLVGVHEDWMTRLEAAGYLDRAIEYMPTTAQMQTRIKEGRGLVRPELCSLMAWTKIWLVDLVLASDLPEDPFVADRLVTYFPPLLRERYRDRMGAHRLHREIITTVAVNRFVNSQGITAFHRLSDETGAGAPDVIRAQLAARTIFGALAFETETSRAGVDAALQTELRLSIRRLVEGGTRWLLRNRTSPLDIRASIDDFRPGAAAVASVLPELLTERDLARYQERLARFTTEGVSDDLARIAAGAGFTQLALSFVQIASRTGRDVLHVARTYFLLMERLGLDRLLAHIEAMPRKDRWGTKARAAVRDDLLGVRAQLTQDAELEAASDATPEDVVEGWFAAREGASEQFHLLAEALAGEAELARISVALRTARALLADRA